MKKQLTMGEVLDLIKNNVHIEKDIDLAKFMGVSRQLISKWRYEGRLPRKKHLLHLSLLSKLDPYQIMNAALHDKLKGFPNKVAAWLLALFLLSTGFPGQVKAQDTHDSFYITSFHFIHYTKNIREFLRYLLGYLLMFLFFSKRTRTVPCNQ